MNEEQILHQWTKIHGPLQPERRSEFLNRPATKSLTHLPEDVVMSGLKRHRQPADGRKTWLIVAVTAGVVLGACTSGSDGTNGQTASSSRQAASSDPTVKGTLLLATDDVRYGAGGSGCSGSDELDGLREGASVTVRDEDDSTIAVGRIGESQSEFSTTVTALPGLLALYCRFELTIADFPDAEFYTFEVGGVSSRSYSASEVNAMGTDLQIVVGSDAAEEEGG